MATVLQPSSEGSPLSRRQRRNSYFEALSSVTSDLNFVASDLKKSDVSFKASSPKSPLAATASVPVTQNLPVYETLLPPASGDKYEHLRMVRLSSIGSNNNASTVSTVEATQSSQAASQEGLVSQPSFDKSVFFPLHPRVNNNGSISPHHHPGFHGDDTMELSAMTRLVHTKPIWFLPNTQRTAAIHYLQSQPVGVFVVCQARDKDSLVLAMKHPGKGSGLYIERFPIHFSQNGVKLCNSKEEFSTIEELIFHHMYHQGILPCELTLPAEILAACNIRVLQSLALFEEEFWMRNRGKVKSPEIQTEKSPDSPQGWSKLPLTLSERQHYVSPNPSPPVAPTCTSSVSPPQDYMVMNKQPLYFGASMASATAKLNTVTQGRPTVSMFNRSVDDVKSETRRLHKSWSFDDKTSPLRQSGFLSSDPARYRQSQSVDDTLLTTAGRQPIRCSTRSYQEFLLQNLGHYPPPLHSPPPPPKGSTSNTFPCSLPQKAATHPLVHRSSADYYKPFESTRHGHHPPSVFSFDPVMQYAMPSPPCPPLPKRSISVPQETLYQQPVPRSPLQYSIPSGFSRAESSDDVLAKLRTSLQESEIQQVEHQQTTFGPLEGQCHLAPVLQPSLSETPPPLSSKQVQNPLFEFDPLLKSSKPQDTLSSTLSSPQPPSQDVFSTRLSLVAPEFSDHSSTPKYDTPVAKLLNLEIASSDDEENETASADRMGVIDYSSEDWGLTEDEDYEEEETIERDREKSFSSTADTQSSHSSETLGQEIKVTPPSGEGHDVNQSSKSSHKDIKKLKKKKTRTLSKFQKYVLKGKRKKHKGDPTKHIQTAIHKLASNKSSYFSMMIECFIQNMRDKCDMETPSVVIRSLRQFMSGMKNYLFNRREPEVDAAMDKYYKLTMAELDAIVEGAIHRYILLPLKPEIYRCLVYEHKESGSLHTLDHNIQLARAKTPKELGIKSNYIPPESEHLEKIRQYFRQLEDAYSPIEKLEHLLNIVKTVYETVVDQSATRSESVQSMGADDFLPMFIYVLVQCEAVNIEIEAEYMWGLLEPSMMSGEGGYYLTTLSSAICVLKQFEQENKHTDTKGFLSVMVALGDEDERVVRNTLPVLPGMNAADVSRILAHKLKITNVQQYQLYLLCEEKEIPIADNECPLEMKETMAGQGRLDFGYKIPSQEVNWFSSS